MTDQERRALAKSNPKKLGTHEDLRQLNDVLYNAGFSFLCYEAEAGQDMVIEASFDLTYYVQLELYFINPVYTDLRATDSWWDAWHDDQLIVLVGEDRKRIEAHSGKKFPGNLLVFQFVSLRNSNPNSGIIVAEKMEYRFLK